MDAPPTLLALRHPRGRRRDRHPRRPGHHDRRAARRPTGSELRLGPAGSTDSASSIRRVVDAVFADNAEHPPLGRWLLGIASTLGEPFEPWLGGFDAFSVHAGRLAPALAFAFLVALVSGEAARRGNLAAGAAAGFSMLAMPRLFAHAHLAALDTFLCLFWTWSFLAALRAFEGPRPLRNASIAGLIWGLALLTKIHAWLLPPIVALIAFRALKPGRALAALALWTSFGLLAFFAGWPWLWYDSAARFRGYLLGTALNRMSLRVQYFGQVYGDRAVPWHYPWFYFAVTVPIGLHLLGMLGIGRGLKTDRLTLPVAAAILLFLVLFSTNVAVYDGERLFLVVFPLWALMIGKGFAGLLDRARGRPAVRVALIGLLLAQGFGTASMHPFGLSYYNALVGGLPGADRLGLELTYWGDSVDPALIDHLARIADRGDSAALAPTLHHLQATATLRPSLVEKEVRLDDESAVGRDRWVVVYRRLAYWNPALSAITQTKPRFVRSRQGVWLSGVWERPAPGP